MSSPSPEHPGARSSRLAASDAPAVIEAAFGVGSPVFTETTERLSRIYSEASHLPQVAARFREWQHFRGQANGDTVAEEQLFINQTYLALLARLVARRFVAPRRPISNSEELLEVINVDYFSRRGISNFGEGDVFSWPLIEVRWDLGLNNLVLETMRGLADSVATPDFSHASPGILDSIYRQMGPASGPVPRWLAEYVIEAELGMADDPGRSLVDPACGTGTFLCVAVGAMSRAIAKTGGDQMDLLFDAPERIRGMDSEPLAVSLARLNYLLALGDLVQEEHPPFLMPVYLANASSADKFRPLASEEDAVTLKTTAGDFPLPAPVIDNPLMLDWVLGRLTNYMDGAQLRLHVQQEEVAVQEVLNAYYNYVTSPKPRTPVPEALTPQQADTLLETAKSLIQLHIKGEGTLWLHLVQNMAAPMVFAHRGFDRLAGSGSAAHLVTLGSSYLRTNGKAAVVLSAGEAEQNAKGCRLITMNELLPNAVLLVTGPEQRAKFESIGEPISPNSSWADAQTSIRVVAED